MEKAAEPFLASDFDREVVNADKTTNIAQIVDLASAFPFGSGKKLIVVKSFEKINDRKEIASYINNPAEFTILVLVNYGKVSDAGREPYASMLKKNYLFEARKLKGPELIRWITAQAKKMKIGLSADNAEALMEMVGEDKALIEMQLRKFADYLGEGGEVTFELIKNLSSSTKEFTIFDLQEALGRGDKAKSVDIAFNLLDSGQEIIFILTMLTKFITTISQSLELQRSGVQDNEAAKQAGASYYYYINCKKAKYFMSDKRLLNASRALYKADLSVKTSAADPKTILLILFSEMTA